MADPNAAPAIGIDLGTTYSCVGVLHNGQVHIIKNQEGKTTIPSYVAFTEVHGRLVGDRAKKFTIIEPENTVNNVKRLIGRTMEDEHVQEDLKYLLYKVEEDENGMPVIKVKYEGKDRTFRPEDVSAMILSELKLTAEEFLGKPVTDAVITVPAYFNDAQRQATMDAGRIAGLNVLGTINEPTAAALAYGYENSDEPGEINLLVYDFGGGTFDISILNVNNGQVVVNSVRGDSHLGGEDIDNILVKHFCKEFKKQNSIDLYERSKTETLAKKALRRLRLACEKAKIILSDQRTARIELDALFDGKDLDASVSRTFFENLCKDLIRKTIPPLIEAVESANYAFNDITNIVLVGGSTRIPMVGQMLHEMFPGVEFCGSINPDEAVAYGAALKAAMLTSVDQRVLRNVLLKDVTPLGLGIDTFGGVMATILPRGTTIPVQRKRIFTTNRDYQTEISIQVFEGERHMTKNNNLLGEFTLMNIPPAPRRIPQIEVTFAVNDSGILTVKAVDLCTECENEIVITNNRGRLSQEDINLAIQEGIAMREQDEQFKRKVMAREQLEVSANKIAKSIKHPTLRQKIDSEKLQELDKTIDESLRMYESFQDPSEADFEQKRLDLASLWNPIITRLYPEARHNVDAPSAHDSFEII